MIILKITAPFATFTRSHSREYYSTYSLPSPATIYGMLLSFVGETDRDKYRGVRLSIGLLSQPKKATVIRTFKRRKNKEINHPENSRPDYQEVLCGLNLIVCVDSSPYQQDLEERITTGLIHPELIERFGGLSLGESRDLIDDIKLLEELPESVSWLVEADRGEPLPIWVDYQGSQGTLWQPFSVSNSSRGSILIRSESD